MDATKIGTFIAAERRAKGWTQRQLADKLQLTDKAVSRWETGKGLPDVSFLLPLAAALDISVGELLAGESQPQPPAVQAAETRTAEQLACYCLSFCRLFLRHSPFGCCACSARMAWRKRGPFAVHLLWPWLGCGCSICTLPQHFPDVQRSRCWISGATRRGRQM